MNWKRVAPLALNLLITLPAFSQVQLFEADVSGIVPYVGVKWSQAVTQAVGGFEYTIDGRTTLGFDYSMPLKDTLSFDPKLKAYELNPYLIFEFVEPDNLKNFSFAIRADFNSENTSKNDTTINDPAKLNSFSRTGWGGGPIFALRIFSSERLVIIPEAFYELFYVHYHRDNLPLKFVDNNAIWHDFGGSIAFHYLFNEFNGITFEPKFTGKIGEGRSSKDLINVTATLGYVRSF